MKKYEVEVSEAGAIRWYQDGRSHRLSGPLVEMADGDKAWYQNAKSHHVDGPAVELGNGSKEWYIEGVKCAKSEFPKETTRNMKLTKQEIADLVGCSVDSLEIKY